MKQREQVPPVVPMKSLDWDGLRRRLEIARDALNQEMTDEKKKQILKCRAMTLAQEPGDVESAEGHLEVLEFLLAYERYCIEMSCIRETYPLKELTPLPCTPSFVLGLINVRGQILSVIDMRKLFGLPEKGLTDLNKVIILHDAEMEFGILADEILGVRFIPRNEIQPSLPTLTGIREEYLKGVTGERTVILDGRKLLADRNIVVNDEE